MNLPQTYTLFLLFLCSLTACRFPSSEHSQMIDLLQELEQHTQRMHNPFANERMIQRLDSTLEQQKSLDSLHTVYNLALQQLRAGHPLEAIQLYQGLYQSLAHFSPKNASLHPIDKPNPDVSTHSTIALTFTQQDLIRQLALSFLRLGELENCQSMHHHTHASCIFPIDSSAYHTLARGSAKAIEYYEQLLQEDQQDWEAKWLLNLAHMTLGSYPEGVQAEWRLSPVALESEWPMKRFPDHGHRYGVDQQGLSGGVVMDDFTGDGWLDLMVSAWGLDEQLTFYQNLGVEEGQFLGFENVTVEANLMGITGGLNLVQGDYNNDGYVDLLVLRGAWQIHPPFQPNSLLKNNGDGTFEDVTVSAGMLSYHPTQTACWVDVNKDGWLDVFIGNESKGSLDNHSCELYMNQGDGTFVDGARKAGVRINRYVKGVTAGDYDGDGWQDLYVSTLKGQNYLLRNEGANEEGFVHFQDVTRAAGLEKPIETFPTWFWDYDQDGALDILVCEFEFLIDQPSSIMDKVAKDYFLSTGQWEHPQPDIRGAQGGAQMHLFRNLGNGQFQDVAQQIGLTKLCYAMGSNVGDWDGDGWQDLYMGTGAPNLNAIMPNVAWRNHEGKYFQEVTTALGVGHLQKGHGVAFGDIDRDGDEDVYTVMGGAFEGDFFRNALFENPYRTLASKSTIGISTMESKGVVPHFLGLTLEGSSSNRSAIGTKVSIFVETEEGTRTIHRWVQSGSSFGANSLTLEIGLGQATHIHAISVHWPSGLQQTVGSLEMDQYYFLQEGKSAQPLS